jgi:hypothetical protein
MLIKITIMPLNPEYDPEANTLKFDITAVDATAPLV